MDLNSLDFQQARIKQVLFKSQLRSVVYGVRRADDALFSVATNPLGQWLLGTIKPRFSTHPATLELEQVLEQLLYTGRMLVADYQSGRIEEAREGLSQIDRYSDRLSALLQTLEDSHVASPELF